MSTPAKKTPEQIAADRLAEEILKYIAGVDPDHVALSAFATANRTEATVNGLIRWMCHKGILSRADLGDSVAWALNERTDILRAAAEKNGNAILLPQPTSIRGN